MPKVVIHYQDRWAVVTGASSGLGRGLAAGLAIVLNAGGGSFKAQMKKADA